MTKIISIPLFQVGILFLLTSATWFLITDENSTFKKKILDFITDGLYYFILTTLVLNTVFNLKDVLNEPYRALLFSSQTSWTALILVGVFLSYRESKKKTISINQKELYIDHILNFFLLLGLANHLFYYYKYRSLHSVLFIVIYFVLYLVKDRFKNSQRNEWTLTLLAILHALIMYSFSNIMIYYQIVFYPYQIISLFLIASILVFYFRRNLPSKQK